MSRPSPSRLVAFAFAITVWPALLCAQTMQLNWRPWSDAAFAEARKDHKFLLLDLEAVWCHWCHVMDEITYRDPVVMRLLNQKYILIKVDQDARPDISNRYQDYGWPATIVFAADGSEIVKRQGYIPPRPMSSMLQAIIDDPSPGPSVEKETPFRPVKSADMSAQLVARVRSQYTAQYDKPNAGWGFSHKYLDADSVEYALRLAARGNALYASRVRNTLHHAAALIDPVWGGAYQYSVGGHWSEPHYEKLISIQASFLTEYSLAYAQSARPEDLATARAVHRFIKDFLTDPATGAFYVSQNADLHDGEENEAYFKLGDKGRRAQGLPRIDKHLYARESGWTIAALCNLYAVSGDAAALEEAERAAHAIETSRALPEGGFRHDEVDANGPYLGDTLAMGRAFLALYNVTAKRDYLTRAAQAAQFIATHFAPIAPGTGFVTTPKGTDAAYRPHPDRDENIALVRFTSLLAAAMGEPRYREQAAESMRYLAASRTALQPLSAGILLAQEDFARPPLRVTITGDRSDANAVGLHTAALRSLRSHELIEWNDSSDKGAHLVICLAKVCSAQITKPEEAALQTRRLERNWR